MPRFADYKTAKKTKYNMIIIVICITLFFLGTIMGYYLGYTENKEKIYNDGVDYGIKLEKEWGNDL